MEPDSNLDVRKGVDYDFFVGKKFARLIFPQIQDMSSFVFHGAEFEDSIFVEIDFGGADLTSARFVNCIFRNCSMIKTHHHQTIYKSCVMNSIDFKNARLNSVLFEHCVLVHSSYEGAIVSQSTFENCITEGVFNGISLIGSRSSTTGMSWSATLSS